MSAGTLENTVCHWYRKGATGLVRRHSRRFVFDSLTNNIYLSIFLFNSIQCDLHNTSIMSTDDNIDHNGVEYVG